MMNFRPSPRFALAATIGILALGQVAHAEATLAHTDPIAGSPKAHAYIFSSALAGSKVAIDFSNSAGERWREIVLVQAPPTTPATPAPTENKFSKYAYPLAPAIPSPKVTIDYSDYPEAKEWAEQAKIVVEQWFPAVWQMLGTEGVPPTKEVRLVFVKNQQAPAQAGGSQISVSGDWITKHPDDLGMMVHELTHLVQQYPDYPAKAGWLVEGIADYTRWWRYEPEAPRQKIDPLKNNYDNSYRITAAFLAFLSNKYDKGIVPKLDKALRDKTYTDAIFVQITGKDLPTLWSEFAPKPAN